MKSYNQFLEDLAARESGGKYNIVNPYGYLGKYQMGKSALIDTGYYIFDKIHTNSFTDKYWTGKDNIKSKEEFLNTPEAQENAIREYMKIQWKYIISSGIDRFIGTTVHNCFITTSGALAGAHLVGWRGLKHFIKKGILVKDGNGIAVTQYIKKFANYDTPFKPRKKLTGLQKDKNKNTDSYEIDHKYWIKKQTAIQLVKDLELDGVIVKTQKGTLFLRTPPDKNKKNNLT